CSPEEFLGENGKYKSAYVVAGQYNRSDVAAEMVKLGYNISANENFPGESVYNIASEGENIEGLKKLHASGAKLTLPSPKTGHTPIHVAARHGNAEMVKALLDLGVPVELKDRNGHTALHIAATKKYNSVIEVLFAAGADPNMGDNEDDFCLIYLPQVRAPYSIWKLFIDHPQINVNRQNHAGVSSLHYMAKWNTPTDIFELMFSKGANINIRDNSGRTPLDMAEAGGHTELVSYLISKGAKRNSDLPQIRPQAAPVSETAFDYTLIQQIGMMVLPLLVLVLVICWIRRIKK
ncbi:MAG: ankyrin repeat domain-containing protein, partial [Lentisphaeria bacterium]|nr:ankyrin repeat domain-containing protein [Lentisphaeria bacterium]